MSSLAVASVPQLRAGGGWPHPGPVTTVFRHQQATATATAAPAKTNIDAARHEDLHEAAAKYAQEVVRDNQEVDADELRRRYIACGRALAEPEGFRTEPPPYYCGAFRKRGIEAEESSNAAVRVREEVVDADELRRRYIACGRALAEPEGFRTEPPPYYCGAFRKRGIEAERRNADLLGGGGRDEDKLEREVGAAAEKVQRRWARWD